MSNVTVLDRDPAHALIRLEGLGKQFALPNGERFDAVKSVSLQVRQGDAYGLIGKSGAGKSTLLRMINLLERPDTGRVFVAGRELTRLGKRELRQARQSIGMIFQQFNLLQNATVFDNVAFPLRIHGGQSREQIARRVHECLEVVGLPEKLDSYPAQLSGGQKQRVAIARALASRPAVLLCDEPTSALDAETTRSVLDTLREINTNLGVTIVIVTHELSVVQALCRQVAVIENGQVAEQFEVGRTNHRAKTALGRELAGLSASSQASGAQLSAVPSPAIALTSAPTSAPTSARTSAPVTSSATATLSALASPSPLANAKEPACA